LSFFIYSKASNEIKIKRELKANHCTQATEILLKVELNPNPNLSIFSNCGNLGWRLELSDNRYGFQMIICQNQSDLHILVIKRQNAKSVASIVCYTNN
jgi:hypothetical protein